MCVCACHCNAPAFSVSGTTAAALAATPRRGPPSAMACIDSIHVAIVAGGCVQLLATQQPQPCVRAQHRSVPRVTHAHTRTHTHTHAHTHTHTLGVDPRVHAMSEVPHAYSCVVCVPDSLPTRRTPSHVRTKNAGTHVNKKFKICDHLGKTTNRALGT